MDALEVGGHGGSIVTLTEDFVIIRRKGALARMTVGKGEKRIPLSAITAVQFKPAGPFVNGYIQFTVGGGNETRSKFGRSSFDAASDENSVMFRKGKMADEFEKLRDAIEAAIAQRGRPAAAPAALPAASSVAQQLRELAELRDAGVLTEEEFAAQKAKLLG